jgi:hypothetical protein
MTPGEPDLAPPPFYRIESNCRLELRLACFKTGTRVKTQQGWSEIQAIHSGELVWTATGRLRRVLGIQNRPHLGSLLGLKLEDTEAVVWCTPEHHFLGPGGEVHDTQRKRKRKSGLRKRNGTGRGRNM